MNTAIKSYPANDLEMYWMRLSEKVCASFSFTDEKSRYFLNNKVAKLIGCLPKIAGTKTPERDGCSNLAVYIMSISVTKQFYHHNVYDDTNVFARLQNIMNFNGGDQDLLQKGMTLLALMMVNDYKRDKEADKDARKYNPFTANSWNFNELRDQLLIDYEKIESVEIDSILTLSECATLLWEGR
ncbi:MAG: hypothetical protein ISR78_04310 [Spirochaetia bacterium]|nr:hypothetical protein [Spirochaetia bacterium]